MPEIIQGDSIGEQYSLEENLMVCPAWGCALEGAPELASARGPSRLEEEEVPFLRVTTPP